MANWHTWHKGGGVQVVKKTRGKVSKGLSADGCRSIDAVR